MTESKALLSQNEIDTLISFLQNHDETPIGSVLDQGSIDKLVEIIKFNNTKGIYFNKETSLDISSSEPKAILKAENGEELNPEKCHLDFEKAENGFIKIFCFEEDSSKRIFLSPSCLNKKDFVVDQAEWGLAVSPRTLIELSKLFNVNCASEILQKAEKDFAKLVYGDENAKIADYYMTI